MYFCAQPKGYGMKLMAEHDAANDKHATKRDPRMCLFLFTHLMFTGVRSLLASAVGRPELINWP